MVALADRNRLRILSVMARLQEQPRGELERSETQGICVCELQSISGAAQSKVSYHLRVLREAGIVRETQRGKWRFYAIDPDVSRGLMADLAELLGV
jgi:ArsR family transcriptional regulator